MKSYYITAQDKDINIKSICVNKTLFDKLVPKNSSEYDIEIFILDYKNQKLYGPCNMAVEEKVARDNCYFINTYSSYRRGIYYNTQNKNIKDFDIIKINHDEYKKLKKKLDVINNQLFQTFFSYSIKNNIFKYRIVETNKSLYVAEYEKPFDKRAFDDLYLEYKELITIASNENNKQYETLGSILMNMLIPESDVREFLLSQNRILYLSNSNAKDKIKIPFEILNHNKSFLARDIIFSYTHAKNTLKSFERKRRVKLSFAVIIIPNEDILYAEKELQAILKNESDCLKIDTFKKDMTYIEFINILENYDIVHIITHGKKSGIMLSDKYKLKHISTLNNPPTLLFMNVCNSEHEDNELVSSMIYSGITTVVSGNGLINDFSYIDFVDSFYANLFNRHSSTNTATAYYFALIDNMDNSNIFLRYRFNGIASYAF